MEVEEMNAERFATIGGARKARLARWRGWLRPRA